MKYALAVIAITASLSGGLFMHRYHDHKAEFYSDSSGNPFSVGNAAPSEARVVAVQPSWGDPLALAISGFGIALAVGLLAPRKKPPHP